MLRDINQQKIAQTRNRTGGPTMATLDFTTKPFALERNAPRRGIEPRSTMRQTVILATKLSRTLLKFVRDHIYIYLMYMYSITKVIHHGCKSWCINRSDYSLSLDRRKEVRKLGTNYR
ncbi:unnamed protein product [Debaryomyces tyrocola]|nr:unnamed protein product [Debaryomyces tyrocola]